MHSDADETPIEPSVETTGAPGSGEGAPTTTREDSYTPAVAWLPACGPALVTACGHMTTLATNNLTRISPACVATAAAAAGFLQAILFLRLMDCWFDDSFGGEWRWCLFPTDSLCGILVMLDRHTGCISGFAYTFWFCRLLLTCLDDLQACGLAEVAWICGLVAISTVLRYALPPDGTSHVPMGMLMLAY